jgi:hypothetical protein
MSMIGAERALAVQLAEVALCPMPTSRNVFIASLFLPR